MQNDNRSPEYIADVDLLMADAISTYVGSTPTGEPVGELPSIKDALDALVAKYGQENTSAALGEPRRTIRRWRAEGTAKTAKARARQDVVRRAAAKISSVSGADRLARVKDVTFVFELVYSNTASTRNVKFTLDPKATPDDVKYSTRLAGKSSSGVVANPFAVIAGRYATGGSDLAGPIIAAMDPDFYGPAFRHDDDEACHAEITSVTFG